MITYYTSDTHWNHVNILALSKRPFPDLDTMNKTLVTNWNSVVKPEDTVFHLGDFAMGQKIHHKSFLDQLNGYKVLIKGNHDQSTEKMRAMGFNEVHKTYFTTINGLKVYMAHIPMYDDVYKDRYYPPDLTPTPPMEYDLYLCGHVHNGFKRRGKTINVGVDVWDYKPVTFEELTNATSET